MKTKHIIKSVYPDSIADECGILPGEELLKINDKEIKDIFDYRFLVQDEYILLLMKDNDGEEYEIEIEKEMDDDLGIEFENEFMDSYRSCHNKCIFCFIDQMPPGMRETLYFKDDDARLSFLQGNYVTLTNMSDEDMDRIIRYRLEPINISFQTMNPVLRCKMLNNRFAGDALKKVERFKEAGIHMNGQIVLCKDINDKEELEYSLEKLYEYLPLLESVSIVPVGLSKFRDGLYPLMPFTKEDAKMVIETVNKWQRKAYEEFGLHFVHASDEWYLLADSPIPEEDSYDGYLQLENGVGMIRLFCEEFNDFFRNLDGYMPRYKEASCVTGYLSYPTIKEAADQIMSLFPDLKIHVYPIRNDFFGERITVTGLVTATDIMNQLKGKELGEVLLIPECMLRSGEDVFLDDVHIPELSRALQVKTDIVKSSGQDFILSLIRK